MVLSPVKSPFPHSCLWDFLSCPAHLPSQSLPPKLCFKLSREFSPHFPLSIPHLMVYSVHLKCLACLHSTVFTLPNNWFFHGHYQRMWLPTVHSVPYSLLNQGWKHFDCHSWENDHCSPNTNDPTAKVKKLCTKLTSCFPLSFPQISVILLFMELFSFSIFRLLNHRKIA